MPRSIVQFHALPEELLGYVEQLRNTETTVLEAADRNSPERYRLLSQNTTVASLPDPHLLYLKLGAVFSRNDALFIHIGREEKDGLRESALSIRGQGEEFEFWKKRIAAFRKGLLRGAYVVNPYREGRAFYPNIYYTAGALEAYRSGVTIKPAEGWNYYLLKQDQL